MARAKKGILGGVTGNVGTVAGSKWRKLDILKSRPKKRGLKKVIQAQNRKLGSMSAFISKFKKVIDIGFYKKGNKNAPRSLAMKYNLANATIGADAQIDYPNIKFSDGTREGAWSVEIAFEKGRKISIAWDVPEALNVKVIGKDTVHIVLYDFSRDEEVYVKSGSERNDFSKTFTIDNCHVGSTLYAWIFFISPDGKTVSDSDYLGTGVVIA